jgi:acetolactate synthase regulatory subunit
MHTRRYSLEVTDVPDVLPRVVNLCRRRGCEIVSMEFVSGDRHRPGRLDVALRASERHARPLSAWLAALVDVRDVRET